MVHVSRESSNVHEPRYYSLIVRGDKGSGYDYKAAERIFSLYPKVNRVFFCRRSDNSPQTRYTLTSSDSAIYIKSTGGKWGKSARLITWG